ncbi:response regulator [Desulfosarcina ovata]|nr:response regulator [Desulfosarcina ovata]BBO84396.1 two-component system response regulator [Desulfosarcina ovata subsp. sediminis]
MRILLIDDEPIALTKLGIMLAKVGTCDKATSGIDATEHFVKAIAENQPYDLVAIDIELPDITGLDLLNRFCQLEGQNSTPPAKKIMVTAHSKVDYVVKAREQCDAFLVKPIRRETLLAKVAELFS